MPKISLIAVFSIPSYLNRYLTTGQLVIHLSISDCEEYTVAILENPYARELSTRLEI